MSITWTLIYQYREVLIYFAVQPLTPTHWSYHCYIRFLKIRYASGHSELIHKWISWCSSSHTSFCSIKLHIKEPRLFGCLYSFSHMHCLPSRKWENLRVVSAQTLCMLKLGDISPVCIKDRSLSPSSSGISYEILSTFLRETKVSVSIAALLP